MQEPILLLSSSDSLKLANVEHNSTISLDETTSKPQFFNPIDAELFHRHISAINCWGVRLKISRPLTQKAISLGGGTYTT